MWEAVMPHAESPSLSLQGGDEQEPFRVLPTSKDARRDRRVLDESSPSSGVLHRGRTADVVYEVFCTKDNSGRRHAGVSLNLAGQGMVFVSGVPFDPPADLSESELKELIIRESKRRLLKAADSLV